MLINELLLKARKKKRRHRVGRGMGSKHGKTCGRGSKGLGSRAGGKTAILAEGGQMPLFRRIPKRGFSNFNFRTEYQVVNVGMLSEHFEDGATVTAAAMKELGLIHRPGEPVKVLGTGEVKKKLTVEATTFSASAKAKIEKAGGQTRASTPATA